MCRGAKPTTSEGGELGPSKGSPHLVSRNKAQSLVFADDNLMYCKATEQEWNQMSRVLEIYEEASGQRLNNDNTASSSAEIRMKILRLEFFKLWVSLPHKDMTST
jgi:hypothetical protein